MHTRLQALLSSLLIASAASAAVPDADAYYQKSVRPVLDRHCVKCHGPIEQKSGLELDHLEVILRGGENGPAVVPGEPEKSPLFTYLREDSDPHMPPRKQIPPEDAAVIRDWIVALGRPGDPAPASAAAEEAPEIPGDPREAIDFLLESHWRTSGVTPAPACDDRTFARRAWLDIAGRIPTTEELEAFLLDGNPDKRAALVDRLLASDEYARHMRDLWDSLLMGPPTGPRADRRRSNGWYDFLENAFRTNRPWNEVIREIIVARPAPENKGAVWFLYERRNEHQRIAEALAPVIYGSRIDCAQCHDHPLAREIHQAHYWGLVSAFSRSTNVDTPDGPAVAESATGGYMNFTNLRKESQPALVVTLNGRAVEESWPAEGTQEEDSPDKYVDASAPAKVPVQSRRARFAEAATTDNPLLAKAFVNHMWAALTGRGIVHPVNEINSRYAPDVPRLLEWLGDDFASNGYNVRRLVRAIVLSRAWQLRAGEAPEGSFAAAIDRPLTAAQLARSWQVAAGRAADDRNDLRKAATTAFPEVMPVVLTTTFQQAGFLSSHPALAKLLADDSPSVKAIAEAADPASAVRQAFLRAFGRLPDADESEAAADVLAACRDNPLEGARQLLWSLITSAEFLLCP